MLCLLRFQVQLTIKCISSCYDTYLQRDKENILYTPIMQYRYQNDLYLTPDSSVGGNYIFVIHDFYFRLSVVPRDDESITLHVLKLHILIKQ
jgi:hypothetical protein